MAMRIEDYALIGDCQTAALVGRDGSIDWLCLPRFDSGACLAALLGTEENGRWLLTPAGDIRKVARRYRGDTLILETDFETDDGTVTVIDCMPPRTREPDLIRLVVGRRGTVAAIERHLSKDGLLARYPTKPGIDGLPPGEGAFLPCSFWLADNYILLNRRDEARRLFERLLSLRNDLGLMSEEYDPIEGRFRGNFPQAFSHVGLVNTACRLANAEAPAAQRCAG